MLKFNVKNQTLTRTDDFDAVADSRNYLTAEFELSQEWTEETIAVFGYGDNGWQCTLESGKCTVPWEVIKAPGFYVSLFCGDLITTDAAFVAVRASGMLGGEVPGTPSPTLWQKYIEELAEKNSEILDGKLNNTLSEAQSYADQKDTETLGAAKEYTNGQLEHFVSKGDFDNDLYSTYVELKDYADQKDAETLESAKKYTDGKIEETTDEMYEYVGQTASECYQNAAGYADRQDEEVKSYADQKVSALRELTVPHTTQAGTSAVTLTDSLAEEKLIGCKIYGSESGVGDLDESTGKYKVKVAVHGQNLLNADLAIRSNGVFVKNTDGTYTMAKVGNARIANEISVFVPSGIKFCVSYKLTEYYDPNGNTEEDGRPAFIFNLSKNTTEKTISPQATSIEHFYSTAITYTTSGNLVGVKPYLQSVLGDGARCVVKDLQLCFYSGTGSAPILAYEQYIEPTTVTATLDTPLGEGEYIDLVSKKRINADGTETDIEVEGELKTLESAANNVVCETENAPSKTEVSYYQDINKVIYELKSAVLAQGANT